MNKKEEILKAALNLFVEYGEQATSMKLIAEEAKCGIGTMYNYFKSKEELIDDLYYNIKKKLFSDILNGINPNTPVKQQFIDAWLEAIEHTTSNPLESRFLSLFAHSPKISEETSKKVEKLLLPILEVYEKGKQEGIIKKYDTIQLLLFTNGAITTSALYNNQLTNKEKRNLILMAWDAIKS